MAIESPSMGSLAWGKQTGGRINFREQWQYARGAVVEQTASLVNHLPFLKQLTGKGDGKSSLRLSIEQLERITFPDTLIVKEAQAYVSATATPALFNHSVRAFFWATLMRLQAQHELDEEAFYLSCLWHDMGITDQYHGQCGATGCFTLDSVAASERFFAQKVYDPAKVEIINNAITLHINPEVSGTEQGWEAHYLNAGTACDVLGARLNEIDKRCRDHVLQAWPRLAFKAELIDAFQREILLHPDSRMALMKKLGFFTMVRRAPYVS
ncbi:metal dependent phosphohydrolase [Oleiphilus messinensis]|uniref:Metal dependent phosphohydrolase n=1 Tax=Oleiphilus messinensis TaxID=141451 RepID=A0A1Y0ICE6_9GAMM|nr:hypothetical protein [Oleiphilus messinensis]ARU58197.1 metal dependent phosphohydrolase [Oleiphilus messinensis]